VRKIKEILMLEGLFQPVHLLIIAAIALLIFGPKKLPELGKGLGDGIRGFKSAMGGEEKPTENVKPEEANKIA
jgi:sec-independent protein translocase protein TatA